jgi:hypothetical protein
MKIILNNLQKPFGKRFFEVENFDFNFFAEENKTKIEFIIGNYTRIFEYNINVDMVAINEMFIKAFIDNLTVKISFGPINQLKLIDFYESIGSGRGFKFSN